MSKCKKQVRCTMCTQHRWKGNSSNRYKNQVSRHKNPKNMYWMVEHEKTQGDKISIKCEPGNE